ncbi:MAG TPA: glycosyltransferase family 87 protein [Candidatus Deferrimicrobiaceae bacterium]
MPWWSPIDRRLNPARLAYAWIAGAMLWCGWFLSLLLGAGKLDLAGQIVGTDYAQFYAAGSTVQRGEGARLYDFDYQKKLQEEIVGMTFPGHHAFITPPFFAWIFVPLSLLPYIWSFAIWCFLGLICLWFSLRWADAARPGRWFGWALTWFPVFASIGFGQNSLLSLGLLSLTYLLWRREQRWLAGLACSLVLYKPQLALGAGFLWLLEWRRDWKALAGLAAGGALLAGLCFGFLPESSRLYLELSRKVLPGMARQEGFPLWHAHTPRAFWLLLTPGVPALGEALATLSTGIGFAVFIFFWRKFRFEPPLLFAGAICLTIWVTPHAMIYDWAILLIPAVLLWENRPAGRGLWKVLFTLIWLATFLSGPLTRAQLKFMPFALQVSMPALLFAFFTTYRNLVAPVEPVRT